MKGLPSLAILGALCAIPAHAGPYATIEANSGWVGSEYVGNTTETALGYELSADALTFYGQVGPAFVSPKDADTSMEWAGKIGVSVAATDNFTIYTELAGITTDDDNVYGGKLGAKWSF